MGESGSAAVEATPAHPAPAGHGRLLLLAGAAGLVSLTFYLVLVVLGDLAGRLGAYLLVHAILFVVYVGVVLRLARGIDGDSGGEPSREGGGDGWDRSCPGRNAPAKSRRGDGLALVLLLFAFAAAFRMALVLTPPSLSDDIYRYVWDGRVQAAGINPFLHAPDSEELRELRDEGWTKVNHPSIRTIYPPLAQGVFFIAAECGLRERGFKAVLCLFDLGVCAALAWLLRRCGRPSSLAVVYAWNPLVVVEVASSGHSDPIGLLLLLLAAAFIAGGRRSAGSAGVAGVAGIALWAASAGARWLPLAYAPIFVRRFKWPHLLLGTALFAILFAPYAGAGARLVSGLSTYAGNWSYNSVAFPVLRSLFEATAPAETLTKWVESLNRFLGDPAWSASLHALVWPASLARLVLLVLFLAGSFVISTDIPGIDSELFWATGLLLVLTPTLHPWYLLWIVPFAAAGPSIPWLLFTGLAPLSYLSVRAPGGNVPAWVLALEWGLPAAAAGWIALRGLRNARRMH